MFLVVRAARKTVGPVSHKQIVGHKWTTISVRLGRYIGITLEIEDSQVVWGAISGGFIPKLIS